MNTIRYSTGFMKVLNNGKKIFQETQNNSSIIQVFDKNDRLLKARVKYIKKNQVGNKFVNTITNIIAEPNLNRNHTSSGTTNLNKYVTDRVYDTYKKFLGFRKEYSTAHIAAPKNNYEFTPFNKISVEKHSDSANYSVEKHFSDSNNKNIVKERIVHDFNGTPDNKLIYNDKGLPYSSVETSPVNGELHGLNDLSLKTLRRLHQTDHPHIPYFSSEHHMPASLNETAKLDLDLKSDTVSTLLDLNGENLKTKTVQSGSKVIKTLGNKNNVSFEVLNNGDTLIQVFDKNDKLLKARVKHIEKNQIGDKIVNSITKINTTSDKQSFLRTTTDRVYNKFKQFLGYRKETGSYLVKPDINNKLQKSFNKALSEKHSSSADYTIKKQFNNHNGKNIVYERIVNNLDGKPDNRLTYNFKGFPYTSIRSYKGYSSLDGSAASLKDLRRQHQIDYPEYPYISPEHHMPSSLNEEVPPYTDLRSDIVLKLLNISK